MSGYRDRLYASYVSTHFGAIRSPAIQSLDRQAPFFRSILGAHLPVAKDAAILDVGCGYGPLVHFLRNEGFQHVRGVDISAEQVALAGKLGIAGVEQAEAAAFLNDHPSTYDLIILIDVLEHLRKDELLELLTAAARSLKRGGKIIAHSVNSGGPFGGKYRYSDITHEIAFTSESIAQVLRATGFRRISVIEVRPAVHGMRSALRWMVWHVMRSFLVLFLAAETGVLRNHVLSLNLVAVACKD